MPSLTRRGLLRLSAAATFPSFVSKFGWARTASMPKSGAQTILLEAEGFHSAGGWILDQQFSDQMGSCMLLAHGLGVPVADANTEAKIPTAGTYRIWVRTRNWTAPWSEAEAPGRFQLVLGKKTLSAIFGAEGSRWHWQDGGIIKLPAGLLPVTLHDLTGFDGRCDAILLTTDTAWRPPEEAQELASFRRKALGLPTPEDAGAFDFVVAGGGIAGCAAAITAARLGLRVALIQDRPVLGGNSSSEIRVGPLGVINQPPYPALGQVVAELDPGQPGNAHTSEQYFDNRKLAAVQAESRIRLFLNTQVCAVEKQGNRIASVLARDEKSSRELRFRAPLFADCTGDATVGALAGADFRYGRESQTETGEPLAPAAADKLVNGTSVMWYSEDAGAPSSFPKTPWALAFTEETAQQATRGDWDWESGQLQDQITDFESVRDHALRAIYGNWSFQKNHSAEKEKYSHLHLAWAGYLGGKRESRRLLGDVIVRQQDISEHRSYPDACVTSTWPIDLHEPAAKNHAAFPGKEFRAVSHQHRIQPYAIPYRSLYSRNIANLFMAGRNISTTHVALGTVRVQRTTGTMGEVVGMAAAVALKQRTTPRGVYEQHLSELQASMKRGAGKSALAPEITSTVPAGYILSWHDEFDKTALDESKWRCYAVETESGLQSPSNIELNESALSIAQKRVAGSKPAQYVGGGVISLSSFGYGFFECRMRIMAGAGWRTTFSLLREDGKTPATEKNAALLIVNHDSSDFSSYAISVSDQNILKKIATMPLFDYHIFGCEYAPGTIRFYFDGKLVTEAEAIIYPKENLHLQLSSAAISTKAVEKGRLPSHVDCDYVRYYRKG